jgi:hypothetical protein
VVASVVRRHGGRVEAALGDSVVAVFGLARSLGDEAVQALDAALEIRASVMSRNAAPQVLRIGVATADSLVQEQADMAATRPDAAVSAAGRLARRAAPGDVLVDARTRELVKSGFVLQSATPDGPDAAPGRSDAFRVLDATPAPLSGLRLETPLVGRDRELAMLNESLSRAVDEQTCVLFSLVAPAGAGKSRLIHEFVAGIRPSALVLRARCRPHGQVAAFEPLAELLREAATSTSGSPSNDLAAWMRKELADEPERAAAEHAAAAVGASDAQTTAEDAAWALRSLLEHLALRKPLVLVVDDTQWADPALLDFLSFVAGTSRDAPILLICIARPELLELRPDWGGGLPSATSILLRPMGTEDVVRLVEHLLGGGPLNPRLLDRVADVAEGNPLFVEEFAASLLERGHLRRNGKTWELTADPAEMSAPSSIVAVLAARIDGLPSEEERVVLEAASVIGKAFDRRALAALLPAQASGSVDRTLAVLSRRELVRPIREAGASTDTHRFKHILVRDAAYARMPKRDRIVAHELLANWLLEKAASRGSATDEEAGSHLEQAYKYRLELDPTDGAADGVGRSAAAALARAAARARTQGLPRTAAGLLHRAVTLLPTADPGRMRLLVELIDASQEDGDFDKMRARTAELARLAEEANVESMRWYARLRETVIGYLDVTMQPAEVANAAQAALLFFRRAGDHGAEGRALFLAGEAAHAMGHYERARDAYRRAAALSARGNDQIGESVARIHVVTMGLEGPTSIRVVAEMAADLTGWARRSGHRATEAIGLGLSARTEALEGHFGDARSLLADAMAINVDLDRRLNIAADHPRWIAIIETAADDLAAAEAGLRVGIERLERLGERGFVIHLRQELARILALRGRYGEAERNLQPTDARMTIELLRINWRAVTALVLAGQGHGVRAVPFAHEAVARSMRSDGLLHRGRALEDLARVLLLVGEGQEPVSAAARAVAVYRRKGATALADQVASVFLGAGDDPGSTLATASGSSARRSRSSRSASQSAPPR